VWTYGHEAFVKTIQLGAGEECGAFLKKRRRKLPRAMVVVAEADDERASIGI